MTTTTPTVWIDRTLPPIPTDAIWCPGCERRLDTLAAAGTTQIAEQHERPDGQPCDWSNWNLNALLLLHQRAVAGNDIARAQLRRVYPRPLWWQVAAKLNEQETPDE